MNEENVSVKDLKQLIENYHVKEGELKLLEKTVSGLKSKITELMESNELDSFEAENCKVSLVPKSSWSVPKDLKAKGDLFNYIISKYGKQTLDDMLTINARSFTSFMSAEEKIALEAGDIDFSVPGCPEPYRYFSITKRAKKPTAK